MKREQHLEIYEDDLTDIRVKMNEGWHVKHMVPYLGNLVVVFEKEAEDEHHKEKATEEPDGHERKPFCMKNSGNTTVTNVDVKIDKDNVGDIEKLKEVMENERNNRIWNSNKGLDTEKPEDYEEVPND